MVRTMLTNKRVQEAGEELSLHFQVSTLPWLIICVGLTGPRDTQTFGQTLFWGGGVRVILTEIHI